MIQGDCLEVLQTLDAESIDSMVTDPPAGIAFMGEDWDKDKGGRDAWIEWMTTVMQEALRVLKPGSHGLVWALPRTSHWTATALENSGFEVRDIVTHLFGSGFPKSHNIGKKVEHMQGYGTALKPASEHWILIRKPLEKGLTIAQNVLKHGVGGINIDGCRVESLDQDKLEKNWDRKQSVNQGIASTGLKDIDLSDRKPQGRFPANLILSDEVPALLDEHEYAGDKGGASRFFYCPKASTKDKGENNKHPTVKNTKLMEYLCRLVTPKNGIVLDPFMGSGSTGVAAQREGFKFVGIEQSKEYYDIACERLKNSVVT